MKVKPGYHHRVEYFIRFAPGSDERGPGAAVTVELCGHWDHDGSCRWAHLSTITPQKDGAHLLVVEFDASEAEVARVNSKIEAALARGQLKGPDGHHSVWQVEG
jgi:hypothetical protein